MQQTRNVFAEQREPAIFGAAGCTVRKDQRIVLIGGEQALAAPRRSEHDQRIALRRRSVPVRQHLPLREHRRATGHRAKLTGDDRGDVAAAEPFGEQAGGHRLNAGPGAREFCRGLGVADVVAEQQRALRAQAQEVTRRQRANHRAGIVDHAEVANAQAVHPPDRHIGVRIGIDHDERPRHRAVDGLRKCVVTALGEHTQDIALGHDAGISGRRRAVARMHVYRRYPFGRDLRDHRGQRRLRRDETRWRRHDLGHTMAVRIGIDARSGIGERIGRHAGHVGPAGANLLVDQLPQRGGGVDRLAKRADAAIAQQRHQLLEYHGRGRCITERRVALDHLNAEPACDALEREIRERRIDDLREKPRAKARPARHGMFARAHSRSSTARSKPIECPISTVLSK